MTNIIKLAIGSIALAGLSACIEVVEEPMSEPGMPSVGSASDLSSFEGARAGQAEGGIMALGYQLIRTEGLIAYWFNPATGACAQITTSDGRYSDVTMLPAEDC